MNKTQFTSVKSSQIDSVHHNDSSLLVKFHNGAVYEYEGVSTNQFEEFLSADSKGSFFNKYIRKQPFKKVQG